MTYVALRANILPVLWSCNPTVCCTNIIRAHDGGGAHGWSVPFSPYKISCAMPGLPLSLQLLSPHLFWRSCRIGKKIEIKNNILSSFFFHVYIFQSFRPFWSLFKVTKLLEATATTPMSAGFVFKTELLKTLHSVIVLYSITHLNLKLLKVD